MLDNEVDKFLEEELYNVADVICHNNGKIEFCWIDDDKSTCYMMNNQFGGELDEHYNGEMWYTITWPNWKIRLIMANLQQERAKAGLKPYKKHEKNYSILYWRYKDWNNREYWQRER